MMNKFVSKIVFLRQYTIKPLYFTIFVQM